MSKYADLSRRLSDALSLTQTPVAVSFSETTPAGYAAPERPAAAGCQYWSLGARSALSTRADDQRHCSIGIHTHNIAGAPATQVDELTTTLAAMHGLDYVRPDEVATIPVLNNATAHVNYAPLASCDEQPAVVLIFANAAQGLILTEALARVDGHMPATLGRPACAVVPQVVNSGRSAASLGCCGARAYLDNFDDNTTLWSLNGEKLNAYVAAVESLAKANTTLQSFHRLRREDIEAGGQPSVSESLSRLSS